MKLASAGLVAVPEPLEELAEELLPSLLVEGEPWPGSLLLEEDAL